MVSTLAVNNGWVATFVSDGTNWNYQGQVTLATFNAPRVLIGSLTNPGTGVAGQVLRTDGAKTLSWVNADGANVVTNAGTSTDNAIPKFDLATGKIIQNSGVIIDDTNNITGMGTLNTRTIANWVDGPASVVTTNLAAFNGTTGKLIQDSGLLTANVVTKTANFTAANRVALANGVSRVLTESAYTIPAADGTANQYLATNGSGAVSWTSLASIANNVTNAGTSVDNAIARFDAATGKIIQNSPVIIADTTGDITGAQNITVSGAAIPTLRANGNTDNQMAGTLFLSQGDAYGFKIAYDALNSLDGMRITERRANVETERMTFKSGGNVGIGVSDPTQKLDVAGTIKTTGDILLTGASVINLGSDLTKEVNAGKIGYGAFTANTLDILGATVGAALPRSIKLWDNVITNGTLTVAGATTLSSTLGVTGQTTINVGANSSTLPTTRGTAGQALTTDGAGTLSWSGSAGDINGAWAGGAGQPGGTCNGRLLNNSTLCAINLSLNRGGANVGDGTTCTLPVGCSSIQHHPFLGRNKENNEVKWLVSGRTVTCVSGCGSQDVSGTEVIAL